MADDVRHITIANCDMSHLGRYAIWLRRGCRDVRLEQNLIEDLGAGDGNRSAVSFGRNRAGKEGRSSQMRFRSGHDLGSNSRFRSPTSVATLTRRAESPPRRDRTLGPRSVSRRALNPNGEFLLN
jgi:hypothetical protein